jgi:hypothetical protein
VLLSLRLTPSLELEHGALRGQIEQLKTALENAQMLRRQKMEYDLVAEKVNTLPSRDELMQYVSSSASILSHSFRLDCTF